jgi:predicted nucleic acid-binding protein
MPDAVFDTNAVSDLMNDHPQVKARIAGYSGTLRTSVVVWGEIRYGLDRLPPGKRRTDLEARAQRLVIALPAEPITLAVSQRYGSLKAALQGQGWNLGDNDLWIAATALVLRAVLVTRDRIFSAIPGLQVEDWTV